MVFDAVIIGAGPAGAATALLLAEAGWSVAIVEKKAFPRRKVCGEFISATSLPLLHKLGLAERYLEEGGREVRRVGLFAADQMLISDMPFVNSEKGQWGRAFGREHLDTALLNKAKKAGVTVWQPYSVLRVKREKSLFTCTIAADNQQMEIHARLMIRAHGSWERFLNEAESDEHAPSDFLAFKAHFRQTDLAPDLMPLLAFPGGYGGLVHCDDGRTTLSCCIRRDWLQKTRLTYPGLQAGDAVLQHIFATCKGARNVLKDAIREGAWLAAGPIKPGIRKRYKDGVFFVGNIAGEAHPIVAEGISMAMQSGWLLSQILISHQKDIFENKGMEAAGKEYAKKWAKNFTLRIYAALFFAQLAIRPWIVTLILPLFKCFPSILTLGAKLSGKTHIIVPAE